MGRSLLKILPIKERFPDSEQLTNRIAFKEKIGHSVVWDGIRIFALSRGLN